MEIYDSEPEDNTIESKKKERISLVLSEEQKEIIRKRWNDSSKIPPSIDELLLLTFTSGNADGRSKEAFLIRKFLVEQGLKIVNKEQENIELTKEQEEYLLNNCSTMKPMEMARELFKNYNISPASQEVKVISTFLKKLDPKLLYSNEPLKEGGYTAPNTIDRTVARIRKYVEETRDWDYKKLSPNQKKDTLALMNYLGSYRFKHQIDCYEDIKDKELFESTFIKYSYDKNDLTQENCDQYILLCSDVVILSQIDKDINLLQREQNRSMNDEGKISMAVVEAIKTARQERNDCVKRQQALYKSLTQERSDKLNEEIKDKASLLNLINTWKNFESRQALIKRAIDKKDKLRKEFHELETLDEMKMSVLGLSIDEALNG